MDNAIIPEVIKRELVPNNNSNFKDQTLNINLNNNVDKRVNNYTNNYTEVNTTYNNHGGFFKFIFDLIILPFKIVYRLYTMADTKFEIKSTLKKERIKLAKNKWVKKYITSTNKVYTFDEIY